MRFKHPGGRLSAMATTQRLSSTSPRPGEELSPIDNSAPDVGASTPRVDRRQAPRSPFLLHVALALAAVIVLVSGLSCLWGSYWLKRQAHISWRTNLQLSAESLASACETTLSGSDPQMLGALLSDTTRIQGYDLCKVVLPNGQVAADAKSPASSAGDTLDGSAGVFPVGTTLTQTIDADGRWRGHYPLRVRTMQAAMLQIEVSPDHSASMGRLSAAPQIAGSAAIGVLGLAGMLGAMGHLRSRARGLMAIRDSLASFDAGEHEAAALHVSEQLASEARVLNGLIEHNQHLEEQLLVRHVAQTLASATPEHANLIAVCSALRQGLLVINDQAAISYANGAAATFLHRLRDELNQVAFETVSPDPSVLDAVREVLEGVRQNRSTVDVDDNGENGDHLLRFTVRPLTDGDLHQALVLIEDITQQRVAEESRVAFVSHATHELRMPLTNIRLYMETLLSDGEDDPKLRGECLNVINQESQRLERVVSDMLSMSEIEAGSMKLICDDVRLDALFAEIEKDFIAQAKDKKIAFTMDLPPKLPVIQADRDKLVLAMQNLVGNAIKYTPRGGIVTVVVKADDEVLTVDVKDTGIGMDPRDVERIFEKFYRANDDRVKEITGSGLGLALAREVMRMHNGDIEVVSELNKGSTFTMTVPVVGQAE